MVGERGKRGMGLGLVVWDDDGAGGIQLKGSPGGGGSRAGDGRRSGGGVAFL